MNIITIIKAIKNLPRTLARLNELELANVRLTDKLTALEKEVGNLEDNGSPFVTQDDFDELDSQVSNLEERIDEIENGDQSRVADLEDRVDNLERTDSSELADRIDECESDISFLNKENDALADKVDDLANRMLEVLWISRDFV